MLDVVTFGEVLWDIYEEGRGPTLASRRLRPALGGAAANVAIAATRLGLRAAVVAAVGQDRFGAGLLDALATEGVDTRFIVRRPERTGITFVRTEAGGEPRFLPYRFGTADGALAVEHVPALADVRFAVVGTGSLVSSALAAATDRFVASAREAGASLVVDLNARPHLWAGRAALAAAAARLVAEADLVKASADDLTAIAGDDGEAWLERAAPSALRLVTRGGRAASAYGVFGEVRRAPARARCVDATGAGDAFLAGVLATLVAAHVAPGAVSTAIADEALRAGHWLGAKAISRAGAVAGLVGLGGLRRRLFRLGSSRPLPRVDGMRRALPASRPRRALP